MSKHANEVVGEIDLLDLANNIVRQTQGITEYLKSNNHPTPTFAAGSGETPETAEYQALRSSLKTSLQDLERLVDGPRKHLRTFLRLGYDLAAYQVALEFEFFTLVPANGDISLVNLAQKAGLDVDRVSRVVRMLITNRFFQESSPGVISHSSSSYVLCKDEELRCVVHYT